jgi:uncharacterized protein YdeI (BOF family)
MSVQELFKSYTQDSSSFINNYLRSQIRTFPEFFVETAITTLMLNSYIYHHGEPHHSYSAFKSAEYYVSTDNLSKRRRDVPKNGKILESAFLSTVTHPNDLKAVSNFFNETGTCCLKNIKNYTIPILDISSYSLYPDQKEFIMPYGIVMQFTGKTRTAKVMIYPGATETDLNVSDPKSGKFRFTPPIQSKEPTKSQSQSQSKEPTKSKRKEPTPSIVGTYNYTVLSTMISRNFMNFINTILKTHYYDPLKCKKSQHAWEHICSVMLLATIVYASMKDHDGDPLNNELIEILLLSCLFHDIGRVCRDGEDIYEAQSVHMALEILKKSEFTHHYRDVVYILSIGVKNIVKTILIPEIGRTEAETVYLAYKAADSIDIARVHQYKQEHNPLAKTRFKDLEVYSDCNATTYGNIIKIFDPKEKLNTVRYRFEDTPNYIKVLTDHAIWSGPYFIPKDLFSTDSTYQEQQEEIEIRLKLEDAYEEEIAFEIEEPFRVGFCPALQQSQEEEAQEVRTLTKDGKTAKVNITKYIINTIKDELADNHVQLKIFRNHIHEMKTAENKMYLFDVFLNSILPLLPSMPLYHRLSSYVHFPYYTPATVDSHIIIAPQ